jgi:hypothetical protein
VKGWLYGAPELLDAGTYRHVNRWADAIHALPPAQRADGEPGAGGACDAAA